MELTIKIEDAAKADLLLNILNRPVLRDGIDVTVDAVPEGVLLKPVDGVITDEEWAKFLEIMNRPKRRAGAQPMTEEEEEELIVQAGKETRARMRAEREQSNGQ